MKKIFFSLLAIAAIASCAKTEDVFTEGDSEIMLSPVAALQTKANHLGAIDGIKYPTEENFDVYAYWKNVPAGEKFTDGDIFLQSLTEGGAEFTNKGNYWGGTVNYYWPKNGSLRFAAYSPSNVDMAHDLDSDTYTVEGYEHPTTTAATWDLLVAPTSKSYTSMTAAENVSVVFEHALSWITVKVVAKDAEAAKAFDIKKVTINDVNSVADLNAAMADGIQVEEWSNHNTPVGYVVYEGSQAVTETATVIETTPDGTVIIPQATTTVTIDYTQNALEGTPALVAKVGETSKLALGEYFGGASMNITYLGVEVDDEAREALGIEGQPEVKNGRLNIHCTKVGSAKVKITAIAGGDVLGTEGVMGGTPFTKEVSVLSREVAVAKNGGWL